MKSILLSFILVLGFHVGARAQGGTALESATVFDDPAGEWYGYITQSPSGLSDRYGFHLNLEVNGKSVNGFSHITMENDHEVFGIMKLTGEMVENRLVLTEVVITRQNLYTGAYWCLKELSLNLKIENGLVILEGNWESDDCSFSTGDIHLERQLI